MVIADLITGIVNVKKVSSFLLFFNIDLISINFAPYVTTILEIISFCVMSCLLISEDSFYLKMIESGNADLERALDGFEMFARSVVLGLLKVLFISLWTMLFIIPGVIAYYRYRMASFVVLDNPNMSASEAINVSKQIIEGRAFDLFVLDLSFFGWWIFSILTLGIGFLYTVPYYKATVAAFYQELKL